MKILQKEKLSKDVNIIDQILINRGVEDLDFHKNPVFLGDYETLKPYNYKNITGIALNILTAITLEYKIGIVVDSDADGFTSASLMYKVIEDISKILGNNVNIIPIHHTKKNHGITTEVLDIVQEENIECLIVPDAGSSDVPKLFEASQICNMVLVIDHHDYNNDIFTIENSLVANCQYGNGNKNLSGVGMCYIVAKELESMLKTNDFKADYYLDLVAIGQIGDNTDQKDKIIRSLVFEGIKNINNKYIKSALEHYKLYSNISPNDLSFSIIPSINAVSRIGKLEEKEMLFNALVSDDMTMFKQKRKKKVKGKFEDIYVQETQHDTTVRKCVSVKTRQDNNVRKLMKVLEEQLVDLKNINVMFFNEKHNSSGINGLVAQKLVSKYKKSFIVLKEYDGSFSGSARGTGDFNLKDICENHNEIEYATGHDNAFGLSTRNKDIIIDSKIDIKNDYYVDILLDCNINDLSNLKKLGDHVNNNIKYFGKGVDKPDIGLKNVKVDNKDILKRGSMLTMYKNIGKDKIKIIMYSANDELFEHLYKNSDNTIDIVGTFGRDMIDKNETVLIANQIFYDKNENNEFIY